MLVANPIRISVGWYLESYYRANTPAESRRTIAAQCVSLMHDRLRILVSETFFDISAN